MDENAIESCRVAWGQVAAGIQVAMDDCNGRSDSEYWMVKKYLHLCLPNIVACTFCCVFSGLLSTSFSIGNMLKEKLEQCTYVVVNVRSSTAMHWSSSAVEYEACE